MNRSTGVLPLSTSSYVQSGCLRRNVESTRRTLVLDVDERRNQMDLHGCGAGLEPRRDLLGEGLQQAADDGLLLCGQAAPSPVGDGSPTAP